MRTCTFPAADLFHERNVPILMGTDSSLPGTYAGSTFLQEIDAFKEYGLSNFEILSGDTYLSSNFSLKTQILELWNKEKKASLLLINGNPLENLEFVKNPETIFLNGTIILKLNTKKRNLFSLIKKFNFQAIFRH